MRAKDFLVGVGLAVTVLATGCTHFIPTGKTVSGGAQATEQRTVSTFSQIRLEGAADINWKPSKDVSVSVEGPSNPVKILETKVDNGCLVISLPDGVNIKGTLTVTASSPSLESIEIFGAGNIAVEGLSGPAFKAKLKGAGNLKVSGSTDKVEFDVAGAGSVDAKDLKAKDVSASISGAGDINLYASTSLSASISGAGNVNYYGKPQTVSKSVSGVGVIQAK